MFIDEHVRHLFTAAMEQRPYLELSDATKAEIQAGWVRLAERSGIKRFTFALTRALEHSSLPDANHIADCMPPGRDADRRVAHDADCPLCGGTGWRGIPSKQRFRFARIRRCRGVEDVNT